MVEIVNQLYLQKKLKQVAVLTDHDYQTKERKVKGDRFLVVCFCGLLVFVFVMFMIIMLGIQNHADFGVSFVVGCVS
jgi:Fe2+ transport system protein B